MELCAYLCRKYRIPVTEIIDHSEGYKKGIASNHGDVKHWFPKFGKSMDTFRADVKAELAKTETAAAPAEDKTGSLYRVQVGAFRVKANADAMLKKLKDAGFKDAFIKTE